MTDRDTVRNALEQYRIYCAKRLKSAKRPDYIDFWERESAQVQRLIKDMYQGKPLKV